MAFKLKICGMREPGNIAGVVKLQPDYMGFIFYPGSKRYVADLPQAVLKELPKGIKATGVFVDEDLEEVIRLANTYELAALQLHGSESPDYCLQLKQALPGVEVIKAFGVNNEFEFSTLQSYNEVVDYFLFDTQTEGHGGSGKVFDWGLLDSYTGNKPYFLSGGIGPEHAEALRNIDDERLYAVDINSRFELEPGLKDLERLKEFKNILSGTAR
jgi:phosphoribosylanthranilate isomerase